MSGISVLATFRRLMQSCPNIICVFIPWCQSSLYNIKSLCELFELSFHIKIVEVSGSFQNSSCLYCIYPTWVQTFKIWQSSACTFWTADAIFPKKHRCLPHLMPISYVKCKIKMWFLLVRRNSVTSNTLTDGRTDERQTNRNGDSYMYYKIGVMLRV